MKILRVGGAFVQLRGEELWVMGIKYLPHPIDGIVQLLLDNL
jgi:hypothetical protein